MSAIPTVTDVTSVPTSSGLGVALDNVNVPVGGGLSFGDLAGRGVRQLVHERLGVPSFWLAGAMPAKMYSLLSMVVSMDLDLSHFACWLEINFRRLDSKYHDVILKHYFAPERLKINRQPLDVPLADDGTPAAPRSGLDGTPSRTPRAASVLFGGVARTEDLTDSWRGACSGVGGSSRYLLPLSA